MKIAKLILLLALVEHCFGVPMRFDFTCSEVQIEKKKFEQFISVGNTSNINVVLHRTLSRCKRGIPGQVALNDPAQNPHLGNALNDPQLKENLPSS